MDLAILLQEYKYYGSLTLNTQEQYKNILWLDEKQKPTWDQLVILWDIKNKNIKIENCKNKAKQLIASSDWSVLPDVNITNKSEFESYRTQLRNLIINPVEDPIFHVEPNPIWSE